MKWTRTIIACCLASLSTAVLSVGLLRAQQRVEETQRTQAAENSLQIGLSKSQQREAATDLPGTGAPGNSAPAAKTPPPPVALDFAQPGLTPTQPAQGGGKLPKTPKNQPYNPYQFGQGAYGNLPHPPGLNVGEAEDEETAALRQADAQLAQASEQLVARYASTEDQEERGAIKTQLTESLAKQCDVQQQLRERELARVEARVKKLRELTQKRRDLQPSIVEQRLDQLLREADGLGWTSPHSSLSLPALPGPTMYLSAPQQGGYPPALYSNQPKSNGPQPPAGSPGAIITTPGLKLE